MKYLIMMTRSAQSDIMAEQAFTSEEAKAGGAHMMALHRELTGPSPRATAERQTTSAATSPSGMDTHSKSMFLLVSTT